GLHCIRTLCRLTTMGKQAGDVRMSLQTLKVLEAFLENPTDQLSGAEVRQRCHLASGTLYPILLRLEAAGWFVSRWESIDPSIAADGAQAGERSLRGFQSQCSCISGRSRRCQEGL